MKYFIRRSSHGHHGSKRLELVQHAHLRGSHAFTHTLNSYNHIVRSASSAITELGIQFFFKVPDSERRKKKTVQILSLHFKGDWDKQES